MGRQFFRNASFLMGVEIILKLKGFIFIPLLTRHFGAINYGVWSQVGVLVATLSPLLVLGTDSSVMRYLPGRPLAEQKRHFSAWCFFLLSICLPICLLLFLFKTPIVNLFFGEAGEYELYIPLVAASLLVGLTMNTLRNWFRVQNNAKIWGIISIVQALLGVIALVTMLVLHQGVYELVVYSLIGDALVGFWLLLLITREYGWGKPDYSIIKPLIKYGLPILPAGYAMWGLNSMDRLFLVKYSTMSEIGVYSLCYSLGYMIIQVFVAPIWNMYPNSAAELFNQGKTDDLQKLFDRSLGLILLLTVPATVGVFVLGKDLLMALATTEFLKGAPLIGIITIGYLFHMFCSYYDVALGLVHKQHWSTISVFTAFVVNLILNFALIPKYSIFGAAVATTIGFVVQFTMSFLLASRYTTVRTNFVFPFKILVFSIIMGLAIYLVPLRLPQHVLIKLIILAFIGLLVYSFMLIIFRVVRLNTLKTAFNGLLR